MDWFVFGLLRGKLVLKILDIIEERADLCSLMSDLGHMTMLDHVRRILNKSKVK